MINQKINVIQQIIFTSIEIKGTCKLIAILCLSLFNIKSYSQERKHTLRYDSTVLVGLKSVRFKGGSEIILKDKKIVLAGVLANDMELSSSARNNVVLKGGSKVTFDEKGNVLSGTLKEVKRVVSFALPKSPSIRIEIMEGKKFSLFPDGSLKSGTLKEIYKFSLTPNGIAMLFFTKGGEVTLRENGTLQSGYLNTTRFIDTANKYSFYFKGWCFAEFNEKGELIKGVRIIGDPNERYTLNHIEVINGKIYKANNDYQCVCAF